MIIARGVIFPPEERLPGVKLVPEGMILRSTYPSLPIFHVFINNITAQVLYSIILCFMSSLTPSLQSSVIRCDTACIYLTHISCLYHIFIVRAAMDPHYHQMKYCKHLYMLAVSHLMINLNNMLCLHPRYNHHHQ